MIQFLAAHQFVIGFVLGAIFGLGIAATFIYFDMKIFEQNVRHD